MMLYNKKTVTSHLGFADDTSSIGLYSADGPGFVGNSYTCFNWWWFDSWSAVGGSL